MAQMIRGRGGAAAGGVQGGGAPYKKMGVQKNKILCARSKGTSGRGVWGGPKGPPKPTAGGRKLAGRRLANFSIFCLVFYILV